MMTFRALRRHARRRLIPRRLANAAPAALATAMLVAALLLTDALLTRALRSQVLLTTEASVQTLARIFVNDHWKELAERMLSGPQAADPRGNPDLERIDGRVRSFAQGTDILKIKIYGPSGLTLYSSDAAQIGESKSDNAGVLGALKGMVASELGHRGTIGAFDGDRHDRDLVSSYVPIRGTQGIEAVLEIYVDRTAAVAAIETWRLGVAVALALALGAAFGGLWRMGRSATRRMHDLKGVLRAARRREHQLRREVEAARESAAALLAQAGIELGTPIQALLAARQAAATVPHDDASAGPLSSASLYLLGLRFDALAAMAPGHIQEADPRDARGPAPCLAELVTDVIAARQAQARALRCELAAHLDPRLADCRLPDTRRLRDMLELLLASAITRSPGAGVQLRLTASPGAVDIDVTDSAREFADAVSLDRLIAARLAERLGASLETRFTPGVGHWHHLRVALAGLDAAGPARAGMPERA